MNKKESIDQLIQIIHNQNSWYIGLLGVLLAVITIFLTFYSFQQKRISDEQVEKFNNEIKKAWEINEDLKRSNETIIQYTLQSMSHEEYFVKTDWQQKAKLYLSSKSMFEKYYQKNDDLKLILKIAKGGAVIGSKRYFEYLLEEDGKHLDITEWINKWNEIYKVGKRNDKQFWGYLVDFNYEEMLQLGNTIQNVQLKNKWFVELDKVNNFWINEVL